MLKKTKKYIGIILLIAVNAALVVGAVLFTVYYSNGVQKQKEEERIKTFRNNVDTMRQISEQYLETELEKVKSWATYIESNHMTQDEALSYIGAIENQDTGEAHIIDLNTMEAVSSHYTNGSNSVNCYRVLSEKDDEYSSEWLSTLDKIYDGKRCVLAMYTIWESGRNVIGVGSRVTLRRADGTDYDYLLLHAAIVSQIKKLWVFPVAFSTAEIGMITTLADYVVPSEAMKSINFMEFVRYYNYRDDYFGADQLLAQLKEQSSGMMTLYNSKKPQQLCYWYYSRLENFEDIDILGYIPVSDMTVEGIDTSITVVVSSLIFLLGLIDFAYILRVNEKLKEAAKEAEQASRSKTQFLSTMSHDIRTPLNAVLGMAELAQNKIDDMQYVKNCLGKISVSGNHLLSLINDILEISRIESGKISISPEPFTVKTMISELESITLSQATGHGLDFDVETENLRHPILVGDKLRLTQVYLNLLNNAVKYTKPGGRVKLKLSEEEIQDSPDKVIFTCIVSDTGIGMSEDFQKTMYETFTRVNDNRTDKVQGTGLGLSIVKHMVELMGGSIECESALNEGTTFVVKIPLGIAEDRSVSPENAGKSAAENDDLRGVRVLIAEDNEINWEIISGMLSGFGVDCTRAENGRICVDKLKSSEPDTYSVVLMDIQMPVMNGLDATRELRACKRADLRSIPIVAMTADAFAEDVQNCIEAGMNAHVAKPIQIDKVLSVIRRVLAKRDEYNNNKFFGGKK